MLLHLLTAGFGTKQRSFGVNFMPAIGGAADLA
jgi:hypothetical protein